MNLMLCTILASAIGVACSSPLNFSSRRRRNSESEPSKSYHYDIVPVVAVEPSYDAQLNDRLVIDEYVVKVSDNASSGDLELAESSHIFRPLFRYRAEIENRRRLNRRASLVPVPGQQLRLRRYY